MSPLAAAGPVRRLEDEIAKVVVGQQALVRRLLIGLLCDDHLLLEGVPGSQTTAVKTLSGNWQQASPHSVPPDLLPAVLRHPHL